MAGVGALGDECDGETRRSYVAVHNWSARRRKSCTLFSTTFSIPENVVLNKGVHRDGFVVRAQPGVPYAMGVLCDPKPCDESWLGIFAAGRP